MHFFEPDPKSLFLIFFYNGTEFFHQGIYKKYFSMFVPGMSSSLRRHLKLIYFKENVYIAKGSSLIEFSIPR